MIFKEITMLDYQRPLAERAKSRKVVGPYLWRPSEPGSGRGFYRGRGLYCDRTGSGFDLRLEEANKHIRHDAIGYYVDSFQDETLQPIIARLPHSRGFLAGWTMGPNMCATLGPDIYPDAESAAWAAHSTAEHDAEQERERAESELEERDA